MDLMRSTQLHSLSELNSFVSPEATSGTTLFNEHNQEIGGMTKHLNALEMKSVIFPRETR